MRGMERLRRLVGTSARRPAAAPPASMRARSLPPRILSETPELLPCGMMRDGLLDSVLMAQSGPASVFPSAQAPARAKAPAPGQGRGVTAQGGVPCGRCG